MGDCTVFLSFDETEADVTGFHAANADEPMLTGLAAGTLVLTADGVLPVEFLSVGDRIVTRAGMKKLRNIRASDYSGEAVRVCAQALGPDHPDRDTILPEAAQVLVRDWRAEAMFGEKQVMVAVGWLVDEEFITNAEVQSLRVFELEFDSPQVIYANGMEFGCGEMTPELYTAPPAPEVGALLPGVQV